MSDKIIDVLPPYEDEVLVSWIVRMLKMYSSKKFDDNTKQIMKYFFGTNSTNKPGLYLQNGLQYFSEHCSVNNSSYFSSGITMLEKMSVLPFYFSFLDDTSRKVFEEKEDYKYYIHLEKIIGIRSIHSYIEGFPYFKFCPECLKEGTEIYLQREHQIQGNLVCWKHGCTLHRLPYELKWKNIDFIHNIKNNIGITVYNVPKEFGSTAMEIAVLIHNIMTDGFLEDIKTLKTKLMCRLHELGVVTAKGRFYNINNFLKKLNASYLYDMGLLKSELLQALCKEDFFHPNPIIYLFLINHLFDTLDEYYRYTVVAKEWPILSVSKIMYDHVEDCKHDINYYKDTTPEAFFKEYAILGDTNDSIVVKHLVCGSIYTVFKNYKKLRKCRMCKVGDMPINFNIKNESNLICYHRYLTQSEYAKMHGKSRCQIRYYCRQNRISGVIKAGNVFLIPKDSPYPEDKRSQK